MLHPYLDKKRADYEFEWRFNLVGLAVFLAALPLVAYVAVAYLTSGYFSAVALNAAVASYLLVVSVSAAIARRAITAALRREGLASRDYQPPEF
jgi:hypothetical protein